MRDSAREAHNRLGFMYLEAKRENATARRSGERRIADIGVLVARGLTSVYIILRGSHDFDNGPF